MAATTLRTWDRRYGLGPSGRDPGRHRRYSEDDLARLQLMRRLTIDGVAPAEAARLARAAGDRPGQAAAAPGSQAAAAPGSQAAADAGGPAAAAPGGQAADAGGQFSGGGSQPEPSPRPASAPATVRGLRRAALALDPAAVDRVLTTALAGGVVAAWNTVIAPALRSLGRQYPTAARYIAAEHLLSGAVSAALAQVPRPSTRPRIVLACAPAEQHCLPLEALAAALAERGVPSRTLGARMPTDALREVLARTGPAAVLIWAHSAATADYDQLVAVTGMRPRPVIVAACGPGWLPGSLPGGVMRLNTLQEALSVTAQLP